MTLVISVRPRVIAVVLALIAFYLAVQSLVARYIQEAAAVPPESLYSDVVQIVNVNREASIPAWYSAALLLLAAALLAVIALAQRGQRYARHWAGLAAIFVYLSIDEAAEIHEIFTQPLQTALNTSGYLTFAWVIVGAAFVLVVGLVYARFVLHLPRLTRRGVLLAAAIYVGGALVIESISANEWYLTDGSSLLYSAIGTVEELGEMLGVIVFIHTLLMYMERQQLSVHLTAGSDSYPAESAPANFHPQRWPLVIGFSSSLTFILVHWLLARELGALVGADWSALIVLAAAVFGLCIRRIRQGWRCLPVAALVLPLSLPVWLRLLSAGLDAAGAPAAGQLVLALLAALVTSAVSGRLPAPNVGHKLDWWAAAVAGGLAGLLAVLLFGGLGLVALLLLYSAALIARLLALRLYPTQAALLAVAWLIVFPTVNTWSSAVWYQQMTALPAGTQTLYTAYSPYQKVDVLAAPDGYRYLYRDGRHPFGAADAEALLLAVSRISSTLARPQTALMIGAGATSLEATLANTVPQVIVVERDPLVREAADRYLSAVSNHILRLDTAPTGARYDLVVAASPPTAYTGSFIQTLKPQLTPGGQFIMLLPTSIVPADTLIRRIAAGLLLHFDNVFIAVPPSARWSIIYAGDPLPFSHRELDAALRPADFTVYDTAAVRALAGDAPLADDWVDRLRTSLDWLSLRAASR